MRRKREVAVIGFHASKGINEVDSIRDEGFRFPFLTNLFFSPLNHTEKEIIPPLIIDPTGGEEKGYSRISSEFLKTKYIEQIPLKIMKGEPQGKGEKSIVIPAVNRKRSCSRKEGRKAGEGSRRGVPAFVVRSKTMNSIKRSD